MRRALILASALLLAAATHAGAQEGDPVSGLAFARRVCGICHLLRAGETVSPDPAAPPFPVIAQTPGLTALALTVSLQGAHRKMPDLALTREEMQDVIAYILSLRGRK
jgi:mono/diheme cytochrome c family protein